MSSRMEIATIPTVNNHYNLSSRLKVVQWSYLQKSCGFAANACGESHIKCSLLYCWPHPGRLHQPVYLKPAAACQRELNVHAGFAYVVHFWWGSSRASLLLSISRAHHSGGHFIGWLVNAEPRAEQKHLRHDTLLSVVKF